jgi:hypothetical protein
MKGSGVTTRSTGEAPSPGPTETRMKETGLSTRDTAEASTPGPTKTGDCGVGVVAGAAQHQAIPAAAGARGGDGNFADVTGRREGMRESTV